MPRALYCLGTDTLSSYEETKAGMQSCFEPESNRTIHSRVCIMHRETLRGLGELR